MFPLETFVSMEHNQVENAKAIPEIEICPILISFHMKAFKMVKVVAVMCEFFLALPPYKGGMSMLPWVN